MIHSLTEQVTNLHDQGFSLVEIAEMIDIPFSMVIDLLLGFQEFLSAELA